VIDPTPRSEPLEPAYSLGRQVRPEDILLVERLESGQCRDRLVDDVRVIQPERREPDQRLQLDEASIADVGRPEIEARQARQHPDVQ
jgi:hypothetical protein